MATKLINLTKSTLWISKEIHIPPSGTIAKTYPEEEGNSTINVDGEEVIIIRNKVINIPAPEEGVIYVVRATAAAAAHRPDVVTPVVDSMGKFLGFRKFV